VYVRSARSRSDYCSDRSYTEPRTLASLPPRPLKGLLNLPSIRTAPMSATMTAPRTAPAKTSLGFICSPGYIASPNVPPPKIALPQSRWPVLDTLPGDVLSLIAYHLVVDDQGVGRSPSALLPLWLTSRSVCDAISFEDNPKLYNNLFRATFDHAALTRRYDWMVHHVAEVAGRGRKVFDLFSDPRSWAVDYKTRWDQARRMRLVVKHGRIDDPAICDHDRLVADFWNVWFLLTENGEWL